MEKWKQPTSGTSKLANMLTILLAYSVIAQDALDRPQEKNTSCMAVCKVDMLMMNASASFEKSSGTSSDIGPAGDQALTRAAGLVPIACVEKMKDLLYCCTTVLL